MPKKSKEPQPAQEIDTELKKDLDKHEKKVSANEYNSLIDQVEAEYQLSWWYMKPKLDEWAVRLKLYNNQKRDKEAVGDPLLFTVHQTVLASLYSDRLSVDFLGRESGDEEVAENLNSLAEYDYDDMEKDIFDYEWDWDASFFGRGLAIMSEFNRELKVPMPEVVDMMTWLRDPRATSARGDKKGRGAMRFGGREIRLSKDELEKAKIYFNFAGLKYDASDIRSLVDSNVQARANAQGLADTTKWQKFIGDNGDMRVLEWFTHWKGKKVIVSLGDNRKKVIRFTKLKESHFPVIDRAMFPISHDWDGVSIPDLIEDKQRARSVIQNLGLASIKLGLHPTYLYNTNKIKNRGSLNIDFNKHIGVDGDVNSNTIVPVERQTIKNEVNWIMEVLDNAAQRATATPEIQQGIQSGEKRTATEMNLLTQKVDTRYSLSAKIWSWSEKRFWQEWYRIYKDNFTAGIDDKVIRIAGAMGSKWRKLTRENIIANTDPDIKIESKAISDAVRFNELQQYRLFIKDVLASSPQSANVMFALRKIGRLSGFKTEEVEQVLPPTIDEMNADMENEQLDAGKMVEVKVYDDDFVHLEVHNKAADTTEKTAHLNAHKKAMMLKRIKPEFDFARGNRPEATTPQNEPVSFAGMSGGQPATGRKMPVIGK